MSPSRPQPEPFLWSGIPDVLGYIRGARVWAIREVDDEPRLFSVVRNVRWVPGEEVVASCDPQGPGGIIVTRDGVRRYEPCEQSPQPECRCGIWGVYDYRKVDYARHWRPGRTAQSWGINARLVGGGVEAHGRVVEGQVGFRAQFARPIVLSYAGGWSKKWRGLVERLAIAYDLPIADGMPTFDKPE